MKRFIIHILVCLMVFFATWITAEWIMSHANIVNAYSYKYNYIKNNPGIKTLLIGHSHFENSVNPYLLGDSVFNFAITGRPIYYDVQLAERLFPSMPNLTSVIFPLGYSMPYSSWHYKELKELDREFAYNYAKYMRVYYDRFPDNILLSESLSDNKMGLKYWKDKEVDSLGYSPIKGQINNWNNMHNVQPTIFEGDTAALCYHEFLGYCMRLAKVCHENHIRFIVVTCPCANSYVANTREKGMKNLYDLVDSIAAYYPIEYFNYLNDEEFRADSLYYNCSHLNTIGADRFAIRLKNDLGL